MNLTKLFNFDFLLQNLKKSRMILTIFLLVVPLFTTIILTTSSDQAYNFFELSGINAVGMYIVPFIFSLCLFGYVYKKNSVDFMCSMPISRKSMFATNTLGGILLILATQLITLICTFIVASFSESIIFPALIWDVFLYQFIAYMFDFTVSNLAMSLSGNTMTQIVVTMLILFVVPVVALYLSQVVNTNAHVGEQLYIMQELKPTYTAPANIFGLDYSYNSKSIVKMLILTVVYTVAGFILFKKRKMEMATESFISQKMHLLIKTFTLLPFIVILLLVEEYSSGSEWIAFWSAVILIYWFLYDLVTNKKVKLMKNLLVLVIGSAVIAGALKFTEIVLDKKFDAYKIQDVTKLEIESIKGDYIYKIEDKELINRILNADYRIDEKDSNSDSVEDSNGYNLKFYTLECTATFNNIEKLNAQITVENSFITEFENYKVEKRVKKVNKDIKILIDSRIANKEQKRKIEKMLKEVESTEREYDYDAYPSYYRYNRHVKSGIFTAYAYKGHKLYVYDYSLEDMPELSNYLNKLSNEATYKYLNNLNNTVSYTVSYDVCNKDGNVLDDYIELSRGQLKKFILSNKDENVDISKQYVKIVVRDYNTQFFAYFITNKVDEIVIILKENDEYNPNSYILDDMEIDEDFNAFHGSTGVTNFSTTPLENVEKNPETSIVEEVNSVEISGE